MDERRRTVSSEDSMIGEALMRVSNTLEAERLTKSLDYQEKLRSRSNIRLILAIICLILAGGLLIVGILTLIVLTKYADPVLDVLVPFLKNLFAGMNTMFEALTETTTYLPVLMEQVTRLMENMLKLMDGISSIDLSGMVTYMTDSIGSIFGGMDLGGALSTVAGMASDTLDVLSKGTDAITTVASEVLTEENIQATADAAGKIASSGASTAGSVADALSGFAG